MAAQPPLAVGVLAAELAMVGLLVGLGVGLGLTTWRGAALEVGAIIIVIIAVYVGFRP